LELFIVDTPLELYLLLDVKYTLLETIFFGDEKLIVFFELDSLVALMLCLSSTGIGKDNIESTKTF